MAVLGWLSLVSLLLSTTPTISALPDLILPIHSNNSTTGMNSSDPANRLTAFPPGPPPNPLYYTIPDTDIALHFSPLGYLPTRNETLAQAVFRDALFFSLDQRTTAKISPLGYQCQEREFLLSVSHSVGTYILTWGMWTIALTGMAGYVKAYPGYDFMFEVEQVKEDELIGIRVGAGFAKTRF